MIGGALGRELAAAEHDVALLVRGTAHQREISWDPTTPLDPQKLGDIEAVVHLSGKNIAGRWTERFKREVFDSRVQSTVTLANSAAQSFRERGNPRIFICASAIGYYGDRGDELLTEESPPGSGFVARLVESWEAACAPARDAGIRVANLRIGVVLSRHGGALKLMLPAFRIGVGGRTGDGRQYMSWISLEDVAGAVRFVLENDRLTGPVNLTGPEAVRNAEFVRVLGEELHRPAVLPVPAFAIRLLFGEMGQELLLGSQRVRPDQLKAAGYLFRHADMRQALRAALR